MLVLLFGVLLFGGAVEFQNKYDYCKSQDFKTDYCKTQKTLSRYDKK